MCKSKNSIVYDVEKDELKIVTYYNRQQYEEHWIKEPYFTNVAYLISIKTFRFQGKERTCI